MKIAGWTFLVLGSFVVLLSLAMDVSVPGPSIDGDRIINNGLVAARALKFSAGALLSVVGAIFLAAGHIASALRPESENEERQTAAIANDVEVKVAAE